MHLRLAEAIEYDPTPAEVHKVYEGDEVAGYWHETAKSLAIVDTETMLKITGRIKVETREAAAKLAASIMANGEFTAAEIHGRYGSDRAFDHDRPGTKENPMTTYRGYEILESMTTPDLEAVRDWSASAFDAHFEQDPEPNELPPGTPPCQRCEALDLISNAAETILQRRTT